MSGDRIREELINNTLAKIQKIENTVGRPYYNLNASENISVNIRVDNSVAPAMFKPDPTIPGGWIANELTFRAMKKDIFTLGESLDELKSQYQCSGCKKELDRQFWHFCPYCEKKFEDN